MKQKSINRRQFLKGSALVAGAAALAACTPSGTPTSVAPGGEQPTSAPGATTAPSGSSAPGQLARNETLYVAGFQWGPPTTFNPFNGNPTWPASGQHEQIYETLFAYNQLSGGLDPLLGKDVTLSDDNLTATITLQDGTHWQDGEPLTTDDVIYTYNLAKKYSDLNFSTLFSYITDITATGDRTLEVKLNADQLNPGLVKNFFVAIKILPKHIWESRETDGTSLSQISEMSPVGSGPYKLLAAEDARIALQRDDNYWGQPVYGLPAPTYVVHPVFKSNDDGNLALQRGEVDFSQQFVPQIWQMWQDKNLPVGTWFKEEPYYVPGSIPIMIINVHKPGLDNVQVRRALAYTINYPQIAQTAMSRYSIPANSSLIIPDGGEKQFYNADLVKQYGWEYNPDQAKKILEEDLKATKGSDGIYSLPDGTRLGPYTLRTPYGWTDWMTACDIVSQNATAAGIEVKTEYPDAPVVTSKIQNGDFDLNLWYIAGMTPAAPWQRFRDVLDNRGVPDIGATAFWDYGRFANDKVPALLDQAASTTDPAKLKDLFSQLDQIFMENAPAIPLMYRPLEFYEFNETQWTGFPTSDNPVAPPMHQAAGIEVLYKIKAK